MRTAALACAAACGLGLPLSLWVSADAARDEGRAAGRHVAVPGPLQPPSAEPEPAGPPVLPDELAVLRGARGGIARELAADVASDGVRPPGERLLALRQLEAGAETSARAVEVAEAMVMSGGDRQLAVNALGVLARAPEGRAALARCAASAPSPDLRDAARVLLARRG